MRCVPPLLLVGSFVACGARTELRGAALDASAAPDGLTADAAPLDAPRPADVSPPVDLPTAPACTWSATPPVALTAGDRDRSPLAVRVLDDRLWVGFQSSNPDPPGNEAWFVRVADALGNPTATAVEVLPSPAELTSYGPLSLWTNPVTREHAAMAWTEGLGCRAVRLDDHARPVGPVTQVDRAPARLGDIACSSVLRHAAGWTFLSRDQAAGGIYNRFHAATLDGVATVTTQLTPDNPTAAPARFIFEDGSFLLAFVAISPRGEPFIILQRHDLLGYATSGGTMVTPRRAGAAVGGFRFAREGATMLLGWSEASTAGTDFVVARTDLNGAVLVMPEVVVRAPAVMGRPPEFGLAVAQGVPGVTWNPSATGDDGVLRLTTLDPATLQPQGTADVGTARFPRNVFLRGTSQGFVAVFGAIAPPTLTQVWTVAFRCISPG